MSARTFGRKGSDDGEMARRREAFIAAERARSAQLAQAGGQLPAESAATIGSAGHPSGPVLVAEKSVGLAYLLWFFFGIVAAHRFYLGFGASALVQLCVWMGSWMLIFGGQLYAVLGLVVVVIWLFADLFLIPGLCRQANEEARRRARQYSFA